MNAIRTAAVRSYLATIPLALALFLSAGDLRWPAAWFYIALVVASSGLMLFGPLRLDEGLVEERLRPKPGGKRWDTPFVALVGVLTLAELLVPGFDRRWGWTTGLKSWEPWTGLVVTTAGTAGLMWAMKTNRFFSAVVRIQSERGHHVIDSGPYRFVRHPGYSFWALRTLAVPMLLGSHWAYAVAIPFILLFVVRTALEDRMLHAELPGYAEYASRVRWRLVPGLW
jgi:protein-S-isoprenylcysteine O-methyltransferase Ste14